MDTTTPLVPSGISHDIDLTELSPADRDKHHRAQLRSIAFHHGIEGVTAYKREHPEAAPILLRMDAVAYSPKPKGYRDHIAALVGRWIADDAALQASNIADVEALNRSFPSHRFNPANHFSKALSRGDLARIREVFEARDLALPDSARSMSDVRKAVKAARAGSRLKAKTFGNVGTLAGDTLILGSRGFRVEHHKGRRCVRVTAEGATQRVYLATLEALLSGIGETDPLLLPSTEGIGELVPGPKSTSEKRHTATAGTTSPGDLTVARQALSTGEIVTEPRSLSERIAQLTARYATRAADPGDPATDPLASEPLG